MNQFNEYKETQRIKKAYKEAGKIQEAFALSACSSIGGQTRQYEGHLAVQDVLSKIDAMTRMFETNIRDGSVQESAEKIIAIVENLYDLAAIKMAEAKKQAKTYMRKAGGIPEQQPISSIGLDDEDEESGITPGEEDEESPIPPDEEGETQPAEPEPVFNKYKPSEEPVGPEDSPEEPPTPTPPPGGSIGIGSGNNLSI